MLASASEISDQLLQCLKLSNLNYKISENPFSVEIKIKKKYIKEFSDPKEGFKSELDSLLTKVKPGKNPTNMTSSFLPMQLHSTCLPKNPSNIKQSFTNLSLYQSQPPKNFTITNSSLNENNLSNSSRSLNPTK